MNTRYIKVNETRRATKQIDLTLLDHLLKLSQQPPAERPTVPAMRRVQVSA